MLSSKVYSLLVLEVQLLVVCSFYETGQVELLLYVLGTQINLSVDPSMKIVKLKIWREA
jgi:hypothetical protein